MKKSRLLGAVCACIFTFLSASANAVTINEVSPDAGELLGTAQDTTGTGAVLESISGTLINLGTVADPVDDVDLYKIRINDPAAFSVTVAASLSVDNDAMLYLFDAAGVQVLVDDDIDFPNDLLLPQFDAGDLAGNPAGMYFLAFNLFHTNPEDVINDPPTLDDGWFRDPIPFQTGPYTLNLTGVSTAVPVPAAVWLFGSGLLGMIFMARKKA